MESVQVTTGKQWLHQFLSCVSHTVAVVMEFVPGCFPSVATMRRSLVMWNGMPKSYSKDGVLC